MSRCSADSGAAGKLCGGYGSGYRDGGVTSFLLTIVGISLSGVMALEEILVK